MNFPGPCRKCGQRNYRLSNGGPEICPDCDLTEARERAAATQDSYTDYRGNPDPNKMPDDVAERLRQGRVVYGEG